MQELITKISELTIGLCKSKKQQEYLVSLLENVILEFNILQNRMEGISGFHPNEYDKYLTRVLMLLNILGFDKFDLISGDFTDEFFKFILSHRKGLKQPITITQIKNTAILYRNYKMFLNKDPASLYDLRTIKQQLELQVHIDSEYNKKILEDVKNS